MIKVKIVTPHYSYNKLFSDIISGTVDIVAEIELPCKPQKDDFILYGRTPVENIVKYVVLLENADYILVIV